MCVEGSGLVFGFVGGVGVALFLVGVVVDIDGVSVGVFEDLVGVWVGEVCVYGVYGVLG